VIVLGMRDACSHLSQARDGIEDAVVLADEVSVSRLWGRSGGREAAGRRVRAVMDTPAILERNGTVRTLSRPCRAREELSGKRTTTYIDSS